MGQFVRLSWRQDEGDGATCRVAPDTEMTRENVLRTGVEEATGWETTLAGTPERVADVLEERFEATGSRGGFMLGHVATFPDDLLGM